MNAMARRQLAIAAMAALPACGGDSGGDTAELPPLLSEDQLGNGWVARRSATRYQITGLNVIPQWLPRTWIFWLR